MNKYTFWIAFISILTFGLVVTSSVISYAWVNSPTTWNFEFGFDEESIAAIDKTINNSNCKSNFSAEDTIYYKDFDGALDDIQE